MIGASSDRFQVNETHADIRAEGGATFFYKDCRPLCRSSEVGAFFATSALVLVSNSAGAKSSEFVKIEVALAKEHRETGSGIEIRDLPEAKWTMLKTEDLLSRMNGLRGASSGASAPIDGAGTLFIPARVYREHAAPAAR
jgi:hypothetical protein